MQTGPRTPYPAGSLVTLLPPPSTGVAQATASQNAGVNPIVVHGTTYTCALGASLQVTEQAAERMISNGWTPVADLSGTTAQRPKTNTGAVPGQSSVVARGTHYYDTTLGYVITWDGATWRSPAGASV
jgi:hypothetical protein